MVRSCLVALGLALSVTLAACGDSDSGDDAPVSANGAKASSQKHVRVYMLLPSLQDEAYTREKAGMVLQQKREKNAEVTIEAGTDRGSAGALIQKLQAAVTQQYDAIAVNGGEVAKQLIPTLQRAVDQGVKVLAYDQDLPGLKGKSTYIGFDASKGGQLIGEYWKKALPEGGNIGVIRCFIGNALQDAAANGFKRVIAGTKIRIVQTLDALCDPAKSRAAAENMLTAHPDLKGIFADTDIGLEGAIQATKKLRKDLILTGGGAGKAILRTLAEGDSPGDATFTFPFEVFGEKAVSEAIALARGSKPSPTEMLSGELVTQTNAQKVLDGIVAISGPK